MKEIFQLYKNIFQKNKISFNLKSLQIKLSISYLDKIKSISFEVTKNQYVLCACGELEASTEKKSRKLRIQQKTSQTQRRTQNQNLTSRIAIQTFKAFETMERVNFCYNSRRRLILTSSMIGTFNTNHNKMDATEWIPLNTIQSCGIPAHQNSDPEEGFIFTFYGQDKHQRKQNFRFSCTTKQSRAKWVELIKKYSPKCAK